MNYTKLEDIPKLDGQFYYLACPYGHKEKRVTEERMVKFEVVDAQLTSLGHYVISPLDKHYKLKWGNLPGDYAYWQHYCKAMLKFISGMVVICAEGWGVSPGVQDEIRIVEKMRLPIYYVEAPVV